MSSSTDLQRLHALGWPLDLPIPQGPARPARVAARHRAGLDLLTLDGLARAPLPGPLEPDPVDPTPQAGDWVLWGPDGRVTSRLPRRTTLLRRAAGTEPRPQLVAVNVDLVFVVTSVNEDFSQRRLERILTGLHGGGVAPVVVLSKIDLDLAGLGRWRRMAEAAAPGVPVIETSAALGMGLDALEAHLAPGRTVGLIGSSGVGKSSLANVLMGEALMRVEALRARDGTGQHTTTHRQLLPLGEGRGLLLDTPGMRAFQPWCAPGLEAAFADLEALAEGCRYRDCGHQGDEGCAVGEAVAEGRLDAARVKSWLKLQREAQRLAKEVPAWQARRAARRRPGA